MSKKRSDISLEKLRSYSSTFSRRVFSDILNYSDFSHIDWIYSTYDSSNLSLNTYIDYIEYMYKSISKSYRCEYVFKNEIINQLLLKKYGTKNTIVFNEFKVGNSIVDFAMMNGESKAFEIKTDLDSPRRLRKQMEDYKLIFNKSYIVVTSANREFYKNVIGPEIGIIELVFSRGKLVLSEYRAAQSRNCIDTDVLMRCLRTQEYENIIYSYYNFLPKVSNYDMFNACAEAIRNIPSIQLNELFLNEIKKRKTVTPFLTEVPKEIRQIYLSMNLSDKKREILIRNLKKPLNSQSLCISRI